MLLSTTESSVGTSERGASVLLNYHLGSSNIIANSASVGIPAPP